MNTQRQNPNRNFAMLFHKVVDSGIWAILSSGAKSVYIVLLRRADYTTRNARVSNGRIAREAGIHIGSVPKAKKEIVTAGLGKQWMTGKRNPNYFHLFSGEDITPSETVSNQANRDKTPSNTVTYQRDFMTGRFKSSKRKRERNTVPRGVSNTVSNGADCTVQNGGEVETLEEETLSRDFKEREKENCLLTQNSISGTPKVKSDDKKEIKLQTLDDVRTAKIKKFLERLGEDGFRDHFRKLQYKNEDIEKALSRAKEREVTLA